MQVTVGLSGDYCFKATADAGEVALRLGPETLTEQVNRSSLVGSAVDLHDHPPRSLLYNRAGDLLSQRELHRAEDTDAQNMHADRARDRPGGMGAECGIGVKRYQPMSFATALRAESISPCVRPSPLAP